MSNSHDLAGGWSPHFAAEQISTTSLLIAVFKLDILRQKWKNVRSENQQVNLVHSLKQCKQGIYCITA